MALRQTPCPVPDVDRALASYIHSREDTLRIRRTLSKYLTAGLRPVNSNTQNQHLNHECPHLCLAAITNPPGLKDSRMGYLNALRARNAAQTKHRELQTSLEGLQTRHTIESPAGNDSQYDNEVTRSYVSLLRCRIRVAELQVVQGSLEKLLSANPANGTNDPKNLVKNTIGEQPDLPAERLEKLSQAQDDESLILKLKKEVLEARASMERANSARLETQSTPQGAPNLTEQVYALGRAREELQEWVEGELAKMEEESEFIEDMSPVKRSIGGPSDLHLASSEAKIRGSYDQYTASRSAAISSYESLQRPPNADSNNANDRTGQAHPSSQQRDNPESARAIIRIFPYIPCLSRIDNNERSLLQQAVYLQAQLSLADEELAEIVLRLSGESHLLPSGSKAITSWGKTATEVEAATEQFVEGRLQESHHEINSIATIVDLCSLQSKVLSSS
ncbi:hypothetical protein BU26DRAFT_515437 [Trematosphaeria pertusa]|uniref:Uncharacterized protein n=1 Tax=Trematosphaeria pertusa TaxID=390896 RepID=A0A6A6IR90_9PLEO|nr:uncharacterized protein BU26DRAFT_515437 [Trematosphaeria pertusa]KAF2253054.1 hypothetical protein BU26DRAFT_515437 [Trematosphaeria pertusa]